MGGWGGVGFLFCGVGVMLEKIYNMRKIIMFFLVFAAKYSIAQQPQIARVSATNVTTIYTDLKQAINDAIDDDFIYIPGAAYTYDSITIKKRIHIIGTGHYPDSTISTGISQLNLNVFFVQGSNGSSFQGVKVIGHIYSSDLNNSNITISKCYIGGQISYGGSGVVNSTIFLSETVLQGINGANAMKFIIEKSIFLGNYVYDGCCGHYTMLSIANSQIRHCLFPSPGMNIHIIGSSISNCIFNTNVGLHGDLTSCSFNYNLFTKATSVTVTGANTELGNVAEGSFNNTFVDVQADGFNYAYNYKLKNTSVAHSIPGGAGIYYASVPYNPNPYNPHISAKDIKPTTNAQGQLEVKVKVKAN